MTLVIDPGSKEIKVWQVQRTKCGLVSTLTKEPADTALDKAACQKLVRRAAGKKKIDQAAFRILFGGDLFGGPAQVDDKFFGKFSRLTEFFPFYVPQVLETLKLFRAALKGVPLTAFFETSFFLGLPDEEKYYALPYEYHAGTRIKKWGFHGILHQAHANMFGPKEKVVSVVFDKQTTVSAIAGRRPLSISLGYTPLEGIMSRTSSGDLDPGIVFYLMKHEDLSIYALDDLLKNKSGFFGMTGYDLDIAELAKMYGKDPKVNAAFGVYETHILKYIGEALAELGGADAFVLSGSYLGPLMPIVYNLIKKISFLGIDTELAPWQSNETIFRITREGSAVRVYLDRMDTGAAITHLMQH